VDPDHPVRVAALLHVRELSRRYDDLVPRRALLEGFWFQGQRWSLGSLQTGIYRPARFRGPAALTLLTAAQAPGQRAPYDDDNGSRSAPIRRASRCASSGSNTRQLDSRSSHALQVPHGIVMDCEIILRAATFVSWPTKSTSLRPRASLTSILRASGR